MSCFGPQKELPGDSIVYFTHWIALSIERGCKEDGADATLAWSHVEAADMAFKEPMFSEILTFHDHVIFTKVIEL